VYCVPYVTLNAFPYESWQGAAKLDSSPTSHVARALALLVGVLMLAAVIVPNEVMGASVSLYDDELLVDVVISSMLLDDVADQLVVVFDAVIMLDAPMLLEAAKSVVLLVDIVIACMLLVLDVDDELDIIIMLVLDEVMPDIVELLLLDDELPEPTKIDTKNADW
jgi:hypothetical protein